MKHKSACLISLLIGSASSYAALPQVNLGNTSFFDGVAGPGTLIEEGMSGYSSSRFIERGGDNIAVGELKSYSSTTLVAHITDQKIFGAFYGYEILIPKVKVDSTLFGDVESSGVADISISPFMLQWGRQYLFGKPYFQRLNFIFTLPTGKYDENKAFNLGSNTLSFNPYYAGTLFFNDEIETSFRLHYLWSDKNSDPFIGNNIHSEQSGQAVHVNVSASYQVANGLYGGVSGYHLNQITPHKINGKSQPNLDEEVSALGGGLLYKGDLLNLNFMYYKEFDVTNRTDGNKIVFKISTIL